MVVEDIDFDKDLDLEACMYLIFGNYFVDKLLLLHCILENYVLHLEDKKIEIHHY
ncbi:MAG: hypothetical protein IKP12_07630 [Acholeplasmatales bacterium]|nr:hypothetical protein [Acholeplasmatales bacterium]